MFWSHTERESETNGDGWLLLYVVPFLSRQAASHIPELPSFLNTNTYMQNLQLFPVDGKGMTREIKKKPTVICPPSLLCLWCLWVFFPLNTLDKPSGWKTYQSITLSVSLGRSLVLWLRSITISLFSLRSHAHRHHFSQWCCSTDEDQHKERLSHTAASSITLFFSSPCSLSLVLSLCVSMTLCLPLTFSQSSVVLHISLSRSLFLLPFFVLCYSF